MKKLCHFDGLNNLRKIQSNKTYFENKKITKGQVVVRTREWCANRRACVGTHSIQQLFLH